MFRVSDGNKTSRNSKTSSVQAIDGRSDRVPEINTSADRDKVGLKSVLAPQRINSPDPSLSYSYDGLVRATNDINSKTELKGNEAEMQPLDKRLSVVVSNSSRNISEASKATSETSF